MASFSRADSDYQVASLDSDLSENRPSSSLSGSRHFQSQASFPTLTQSRRNTENGNNSECVITCSQIILHLEKYLVDELKVLDLILGIVKRVIEKLNPLVGGQLGPRNTKCLALFSTILYQLVELLEAGCATFLAEQLEDKLSHSRSDPLGGSLNDLGFSASSGDHRRFRAQVVLEELQPIAEVTRKVIVLSNPGSNGYDSRNAAGQERVGCHRDLERRLMVLMERVKRRGGL